MSEIDLRLEYLGGLTVPTPAQRGLVAIVGPPNPNAAAELPITYGRAAEPYGLGAETDRFELFPATYRVQTLDAAPFRVATIPVPPKYQALVKVSALAKGPASRRRLFERARFENDAGTIVALYGPPGFTDDEAPIGPLGVGGLTQVIISTGVQIYVTGIAATTIDWTVELRAEVVRMAGL